MNRMNQFSMEKSLTSKQRVQSQDAFEKKAHQWKGQAETASKFRKIADRSSHLAEDLAEHAEEEREAANLRRVAKEADHEVDKARKEADRLEKANESYENSGYEEIFSITEKRKQTRAELLADYEKRKNTQEIAEERANELKRQYETSDNLLSDTVKNIRSHVNTTHNQQQQNENALLAVNN